MNDTGVIDQFLTVFTQYIDSGFGLLGGEVGFLSTTLIVIDVTIAALFWACPTHPLEVVKPETNGLGLCRERRKIDVSNAPTCLGNPYGRCQ